MAKLIKSLFGQPNGEYMPRVIPAGEECPPELEEAAIESGALEKVELVPPDNKKVAPAETKPRAPAETKAAGPVDAETPAA
jgi:hypothetical protein